MGDIDEKSAVPFALAAAKKERDRLIGWGKMLHKSLKKKKKTQDGLPQIPQGGMPPLPDAPDTAGNKRDAMVLDSENDED